jgi:hypothetical protein
MEKMMPKYYVYSGNTEKIRQANDEKSAIISVLKEVVEKGDDVVLSELITANEVGFDFNPCNDCNHSVYCETHTNRHKKCEYCEPLDNQIWWTTETALKEAGLDGIFQKKTAKKSRRKT